MELPDAFSDLDHDTSSFEPQLDRRQMLARAGLVMGAFAFGGAVVEAAGASGRSTAADDRLAASAKGPGTVTMLGWQGYDLAAARKPFEAAGGTLKTTYISNNDEILTKLRAGQGSIYSVVTPSAAYLPVLVAAGVLQPLDYSRLPNAKGYFKFFYKPKWNTFGGHTWGAPIQWGDAPCCYRPDLLKKGQWRPNFVVPTRGSAIQESGCNVG